MQGRLVPWEPCVQGLQTQGDGHLPAVPQSDPSLSSLRGMQLEPAAFRGGGGGRRGGHHADSAHLRGRSLGGNLLGCGCCICHVHRGDFCDLMQAQNAPPDYLAHHHCLVDGPASRAISESWWDHQSLPQLTMEPPAEGSVRR